MIFRILYYKDLESRDNHEVLLKQNTCKKNKKSNTKQKINKIIPISGILEIQFYKNFNWNSNNIYFEYDLFYINDLIINIKCNNRKYRISVSKDNITIYFKNSNTKTNSVSIPLAIMKRIDNERNIIYGNDFPKDILLMIFDQLDLWRNLIKLTHVCHRWREIVFESNLWNSVNMYLASISKIDYALFLFENRNIMHKFNSIILNTAHQITLKSNINKPFNKLIDVSYTPHMKEPLYVKKLSLRWTLNKLQFLHIFKYFPITTKANYRIEGKSGNEDDTLLGEFNLNDTKTFGKFAIPLQRVMTPLGTGYTAGIMRLSSNYVILFLLDKDLGASYWSGFCSYTDYIDRGFYFINNIEIES